MYQGTTLEQLKAEVSRQAGAREDYVFTTGELKLISGGVGSKEPAPLLSTPAGQFPLTQLALAQIGERVGMPLRYLRKLQAENPNLCDICINTHLFEQRKEWLVRTLDGQVRAVLSHRYRRLDNDALLASVTPVFEEMGGLKVESTALTPTRLYLKLVSPRLTGEVRVNDPVAGGVHLCNSEVGCSSISVELLIFRLVCTNGAIVGDGVGKMRRYHFGQVVRGNDGPGYQLMMDETREAADTLFWQELRQAVRSALQEQHFQKALEAMRTATGQKVEAEPAAVVERLANRYGLRDNEREAILSRLLESGDLTQWGLSNAITRMSQDVGSYDRATDLERLGGSLLHLSPREWKSLSMN